MPLGVAAKNPTDSPAPRGVSYEVMGGAVTSRGVARSAKLEAVIAVHADGVGADSQIEESDRLDCEIISGLGAVRQRAGNTGKNRVAGDIAGVGAGGLEIDDSRYIEQSIGGGAEVGDVGAPLSSEDFLGGFIVTDASG